VKEIFLDLRSWEPLKILKPEVVLNQAQTYPYMSKNRIKISLDCPFKCFIASLLKFFAMINFYRIIASQIFLSCLNALTKAIPKQGSNEAIICIGNK
jgi:hypothetical protein